MSTLVLRNVKGSPLTFTEMDNNFSNLNADKLDISSDNYVTTTTAGTVVTFSNTDALPGRFDVTTATTGGFEAGAHHCQVQFDFITTTYFSQLGGHFGVITHGDPATVASYLRGNGVLIGTTSNGYITSSDITNANIMLESWFGNYGAATPEPNVVFPGSDMPAGYALQDGINYRVIVDSCVDYNSTKWFRYRIYRKESSYMPDTIDGTAGYWLMLHDTGYWLDSTPWNDVTNTGVIFYEVFSPSSAWTIVIKNLEIRWGPYLGQAEEATAVRQFRAGAYQSQPLFVRSDAFGPTGVNDTFRMDGFTNAQLMTYATTYPNFNWNDWCDVNDIKNKLTAAGMSTTTATQVEGVLRPLYCIVGQLCKQAKNRGW